MVAAATTAEVADTTEGIRAVAATTAAAAATRVVDIKALQAIRAVDIRPVAGIRQAAGIRPVRTHRMEQQVTGRSRPQDTALQARQDMATSTALTVATAAMMLHL